MFWDQSSQKLELHDRFSAGYGESQAQVFFFNVQVSTVRKAKAIGGQGVIPMVQNDSARRGHSSQAERKFGQDSGIGETLDRRGGSGLQVSLRGLWTFLRISSVERFADGSVMSQHCAQKLLRVFFHFAKCRY